MARVEREMELTREVAVLRTLIDRLLDEGRQPGDPILVACSLVLSGRLAELRLLEPQGQR